MNILFYQDLPSINSTLLTWTLCEELRLRGHHVDYGKPASEHYKGVKYDWVHGAGQDTWEALNFARVIGARCHIHLEGVAYWRIGYENAVDWGYDRNHTPNEIEYFTNQYKQWMSAAFEADSCTVNGIRQIETIEWMFGKKLPNCYLMCCGADTRYALALPGYKKQNYMVTISRLEPCKKVFMIAESLGILKKRGFDVPPWVIIGYGTNAHVAKLISICRENSITFSLSSCFGATKWSWIKKSKLMLAGWMGIPPAEGIVCRIPVLSFAHVDILEMFEDTIWFADNPESYASRIEFLLNPENQNEIKTKNNYAIDRLLDIDRHGQNELYATTQERAAKKYSEIFMEEKLIF